MSDPLGRCVSDKAREICLVGAGMDCGEFLAALAVAAGMVIANKYPVEAREELLTLIVEGAVRIMQEQDAPPHGRME